MNVRACLGLVAVIRTVCLIGCAAALAISGVAQAPPLLAPCFGDNMVLSHQVQSKGSEEKEALWGWAKRKEHVSIRLRTRAMETNLVAVRANTGDQDGSWIWRLPWSDFPAPPGGPYDLTIRVSTNHPTDKRPGFDDGRERRLTNVMVGQVWAVGLRVGRGVPHRLGGLPDGFRLFRVRDLSWNTPNNRGRLLANTGPLGGWEVPGRDGSSDRVPNLVAYMAKELVIPDGSVPPVGIILAEWEANQDKPGTDTGESRGGDDKTGDSRAVADLRGKLERAMSRAEERCTEDHERALKELLQSKRYGRNARSLPDRVSLPTRRLPPADKIFMCEVNGYFW